MDDADHTNHEKRLFERALDAGSGAERLTFLRSACGEDSALLARVQALLAAHEAAEGFLPGQPISRTTLLVVSEKPGDRIGRYKLREKIGEGGCGIVYVAEQEEPVRRKVALKVIKLGMDTKAVVARFDAERQALAMMDHPNIAKVLDAGATDTGRPYFVMELVRGIRITDYCDQNRLSTRARLDLFIQVCRAVQHAHQKGIIHRDLKPSNILITVHDGFPVPKVIDFGIAKATEGRLTQLTIYTELNQFIGTPAYMSPEQAEMSGLDIDTRSDVYSLGVLLYELLTGKTPFAADELLRLGLDEMLRTIREKDPVRPSTRLSTMLDAELTTTAKHRASEAPRLVHLVRGDLDWVVMKCLEKDRTRCYETANGLAADLNRHLTNEPVVARPPSTAYRCQKAFRRNKLVFSAGLAMVLALLAGLILASMGWRQTGIERDRALQARADEEAQRTAAQANAVTARTSEAEARHLLYVANMNLAQAAWEENNVGRVRQLLEDTATYPDRGFEWYYWQRQTHLEVKTLTVHSAGISSVAFSPDGRRMVTGSWDHTAKIWDAATSKELLTIEGHLDGVNCVAFSPDGQRIVTGSGDVFMTTADHTAKVWDATSGKQLLTLKGHSGGIRSVAFSPDGRRIVTGSSDRTAKVWDAATGQELLRLIGHTDEVASVAFSSDGRRIVTGSGPSLPSFDCTAKVWETATGKQLLTLKGHAGGVFAVAFAADGRRIVTGSHDHTAKVWDAASGKELLTLKGHNGAVLSAAFSPDSQRIVTGSEDQTAKVWDASNGEELFTLKGHAAQINSLVFSANGEQIVTVSGDWRSKVDHTVKVWDAAGSKEVVILKGDSDTLDCSAFSPDGRRVVTGGLDGTPRVWNTASGKELLIIKADSSNNDSVAFSPDGLRIVTGNRDKTAKVWDAVTGKEMLTLKGHSDAVSSVGYSQDGQRIVTGSRDGSAKVWDAGTGRELRSLKVHSGWVFSVAFSSDGQRIVTGGMDKLAKIWETATGKELLALRGHNERIYSVAYSPDGQRIVTGSGDGTAKVWDAASGRDLLTLTGHKDQVWCVGFSPDGRRMITGSPDRTAKVWEAASGKELLTLKGHNAEIHSVGFSPDGQRIVTASWDKTARVWERATVQEVAGWQEEERAATQYLTAQQQEAGAPTNRSR